MSLTHTWRAETELTAKAFQTNAPPAQIHAKEPQTYGDGLQRCRSEKNPQL